MKSKKNKVGLITYHAAYNFGSALQAYATIKTVEKLGYEIETIDYRTQSQTQWYNTDWSLKKNYKSILLDFGFIFQKSKRNERRTKFEKFIKDNLNPTLETFRTYEEICNFEFDYDILISGSDQIWNIGCGEFKNEPSESILPYFLQFGNPQKRIAYGSSFGWQNLRYIKKKVEILNKFDFLSAREPLSRNYMRLALKDKDIRLVCDPTWLLNKQEWFNTKEVYKPQVTKKYLFVYFLYWHSRFMDRWMDKILDFADKKQLDVIMVSPLNYYKNKKVKVLDNAGPEDFLSYMLNASFVITNTFHGTIFAMNFEIPFYSCGVAIGSRQDQILKLCGLEERVTNSPFEILEEDCHCDFQSASKIIEGMRQHSLSYLKDALNS